MSHSRRNKAYLKELFVDGSKVEVGKRSANHTDGMSVKSEVMPVSMEDVRFTDVELTVTDTGGANGGFIAQALLDLPSTRCYMIAGFADITVKSIGSNLSDSTFTFSVATTAATGGNLTGATANLVGSFNVVVTSGTGTGEGISSVVSAHVDGTTATHVYLNGFIPDAAISADDTLVASGIVRIFYIDISDGE